MRIKTTVCSTTSLVRLGVIIRNDDEIIVDNSDWDIFIANYIEIITVQGMGFLRNLKNVIYKLDFFYTAELLRYREEP